ncbi:type VII secretion-associated protein [Mycobacterium aquaticum]|uniref:Type VII secretion-associated protein n=1 Tax=Mycobacterium aquaticum TaxID=1927124 RepID=A0A1W9ZW81_9MYCO|nr:type VII secretion-associated protein [Mycobacterium aquaticum]ORA21993.1 type VII secretion-associated protein [Mycobacterium aquaticum]
MTTAVIEAGPVLVRGKGTVPAEAARIAVECIDDSVALVDDEPVSVDELWAQLIRAAAGRSPEAPIVVCPTWWTTDQADRIRTAAAELDGVVLRRAQALAATLDDASWAVVEIADELVMVSCGDGEPMRLVRRGEVSALAAEVVGATRGAAQVIVDAPGEVGGAAALAGAVGDALRACGTTISMAGPRMLGNGARAAVPRQDVRPSAVPRRRRGNRHLIGIAVAVAITCVGLAARPAALPRQTALVEGRVGIQIPADWHVRRVTSGPGSARVEVVSVSDPDTVIYLTQSPIDTADPQAVADTLRRALDEQPAGVFTEFNPADRIADRPVVSYREVRGGRDVGWAVFADKTVRIAVGCQGPVDRRKAPCEAAIRSAHAVP